MFNNISPENKLVIKIVAVHIVIPVIAIAVALAAAKKIENS